MRHFSFLPLASYALMLAFAGYGALVVGHWPYYAHPDPKELPLRPLFNAVVIIMLAGAASLLLVPFGYGVWRAVLSWRKQPPRTHRKPVLIYGAGAAIWIFDLVALHDNLWGGSLASWLLD